MDKIKIIILYSVTVLLLLVSSACLQLIDFIFIGGTGSLAKKHILPSVLQLQHNKRHSLRLFSCGRSKQVIGHNKLQSILQEIDVPFSNYSIHYQQLERDEDYNTFCRNLGQVMPNSKYQRIFYVAIPPKDYLQVLKIINNFCTPTNGTLKVILEKPFGISYNSAELLYSQVKAMPNVQVYIVDHYLWKKPIRYWPIFRAMNDKWLNSIWDSDHIEDISFILLETEDVNDRIYFYDSCGVIVDILQTHLTQLLLHLIAYKDDPLIHLSHVKQISSTDVYLAQYQPYPLPNSHTPTFALAVLRSLHSKWRKTKFYLKSGKALDTKTSMIGIRLKQPHLKSSTVDRWCEDEISHVMLLVTPKPAILIHKQLLVENFFLVCGPEWNSSSNLVIEDLNISNYHVCAPQGDRDDSYEQLLDAIFSREKRSGQFLTPESALASWLPWEKVVLNDEIEVNSYEKKSVGPKLCFDDVSGWEIKEKLKVVKDEF